MSVIVTAEYKTFLREIKERIHKAQYDAFKAVNKELIQLYWDIGKSIVTKQDRLGWGKSIVETLAKDLQKEFPGIQGYSAQNLWRMKQFYQTYASNEKLSPIVREIGWTQNLIIMMGCNDDLEREFYIRMTRKFGWTKNVLIHQIENKTFEKTLINQTNFDKALPEKIKNQAKLAVKDEYTFDFLELGEGIGGMSTLFTGIVNKLQGQALLFCLARGEKNTGTSFEGTIFYLKRHQEEIAIVEGKR